MSAITAVAPQATETPAKLEREILTRIARGGLLICETELRYQLRRRGHERPDLLELLADLKHRGLIQSETHYRLTAEGAARVPVADRPSPRAISSIPWTTSASVGTGRQTPGRPGPSSAEEPPRNQQQ
jgi:hypothetical protein